MNGRQGQAWRFQRHSQSIDPDRSGVFSLRLYILSRGLLGLLTPGLSTLHSRLALVTFRTGCSTRLVRLTSFDSSSSLIEFITRCQPPLVTHTKTSLQSTNMLVHALLSLLPLLAGLGDARPIQARHHLSVREVPQGESVPSSPFLRVLT